MGTIISRRDFQAVIKRVRQGVFLLTPKVNIPIEAVTINIGLLLGERMHMAKNAGQTTSISTELEAILDEKSEDLFLKNTDILFSPEYRIDVIKLLLQLGRNRRLFLIWPGEVTSTRLTYSEPDRFDYKEYNIKDYVDTYVILR